MGNYSPLIQEHFLHPRNSGLLPLETKNSVRFEAGSKLQGKWLVFYLLKQDGQIKDVRYQVYGCPSTIATASLLSELLKLPQQQWQQLTAQDLFERFELAPTRYNCAILAEQIIQQILVKGD